MNVEWAMGVVVGLLIVAVACLVVRKIVLARGGKPGEYDERQQIVRGRAFTVAYATILIYLAAWMVLNAMQVPFFSNSHSVLLGLLLSVAVFAGYSIFHDAYFRTSDRPAAWLAVLAVVSALNLAIGIGRLVRGATLEARLYENANLMTGIMLAAILVCALIKLARDRRGGEE